MEFLTGTLVGPCDHPATAAQLRLLQTASNMAHRREQRRSIVRQVGVGSTAHRAGAFRCMHGHRRGVRKFTVCKRFTGLYAKRRFDS
jgi:hypothetical protein